MSKRLAILAVGAALTIGAAACAEKQKTDEAAPEATPAPAPVTPGEETPDIPRAQKKPEEKPAEGQPEGAKPAPAAAPAPEETGTPTERTRAVFTGAAKKAQGGNQECAASEFARAFQIDPTLTWAPYNVGVIEERLGDTGKARDAYQQA